MDDEVPTKRLPKLLNFIFGSKKQNFEFPNNEWVEDFKDFFQTDVHEVMVPRMQVRTIEYNQSLEAALEIFKESGYSRIPVQKEKKDNIVGVLHAKDIFFSLNDLQKPVDSLMRKALFIPSEQKIYQALEFFRSHKIHFAIVVDNYGGVDGIVTLEDIIEELFGEFQDEFDKDESPAMSKSGENTYVIDADHSLEEFNESFETKFDKEGIETIGGYICDKIGKIGETGDVFESGRHEFEIIESNPRQILKIKYTRHADVNLESAEH